MYQCIETVGLDGCATYKGVVYDAVREHTAEETFVLYPHNSPNSMGIIVSREDLQKHFVKIA